MARKYLFGFIALMLLGSSPALRAETSEVAAGRDDYFDLCSDCHGQDAKGNGHLTPNLTKVPPDLTAIKRRAHGKFDEKAVAEFILGLKTSNAHGTREMPIWGDWLTDDMQEDDSSTETAPLTEKQVELRVMAIVKYLEGLQN